MEDWKPQIWKAEPGKKCEQKPLPAKYRLPAGAPEGCIPIADIDVTFADLKDPAAKDSLFPIIEFLRAFWVGDDKQRETNCRIGTMFVYFNKDGNIHMDFVSRFALPKESREKVLKILKQAWHSINNS